MKANQKRPRNNSGFHMSSSCLKRALNFLHDSRPLFYTITSITSSFVFRSGQNRSVSFVIMAQFVKEFEHEEKRKQRVIKTRKNTPEERNRQRKEWRKRKQEKQMANSTNKNGELQQSLNHEVNDLVLCTSEAEKKKPRPSDQEPENIKKPRLLALKPGSGEKKVDSRGYSRASKMYSTIPISRTHGFSKFPITRTKPNFHLPLRH